MLGPLSGQRQADQAPTVFCHEVDGIGRGHLRRDDEIALILAVLVIDKNEHAPVARVIKNLVDRRQKVGVNGKILQCVSHLILRSSVKEARNIARQLIDFHVQPAAGLQPAECRHGLRMGDNIDPKTVSIHFVDGQ